MDHCISCLEPQESLSGTIDLNEEGLCEACQDARDLAAIQDMESRVDFDYYMNERFDCYDG